MIHLQPRGVLATISRRVAPCIAATRHSSTFTPVDLAFDVYEPKSRLVTDQNMVICHGLFGSKQNWRSLAKAFAQKLGMNVYTIVRVDGLAVVVVADAFTSFALIAHRTTS